MTVRDIIDARELTQNLTIRDLKVRYKGSALGFFWSLLNPLLLALVFTLVFRFFLKLSPPVNPDGRSNFALYLLTGLLPWNYLVNCLGAGTISVTSSGGLIRKVFFPRQALPLSVVLAHGVSFLLELSVLFVFLGAFRFAFWKALYMLPLVLVLWATFVLGLSMLLAAINVYFRDTQQLLAIGTLVWFYLTPIIYQLSFVQNNLHGIAYKVYLLNPATAFVEAFHKILYYHQVPSGGVLLYMPVAAAIMLLVGWSVFSRLEPRFAEEV
jgi:homopolymeric O-antigen transport system permease protein